MAGVVCLLVAGAWAWGNTESRSAPELSCSWPLRVRGEPAAGQAGAVRCYLRALAQRDMTGLYATAYSDYGDGSVRLTTAALRHSADARAGLATATFTASPIDTGLAEVAIDYADGARDDLALQIADPRSANSWRFNIGNLVRTEPARTPPTAATPSP
ncbi:MAG: hypothetical protein ABSA03_02370 [Streptosporangiaceae bacterium]|jgi:hypothetical protein